MRRQRWTAEETSQEPLVDVSHCPSVHSRINPDLKEQLQPAPYGSLPSVLAGLLWGFDIGWGKGEAAQSVFPGMNSQLTWKDKKWLSDPGKVFSSSPLWNRGAHSNWVSCRDITLRVLLWNKRNLHVATKKILWTVGIPHLVGPQIQLSPKVLKKAFRIYYTHIPLKIIMHYALNIMNQHNNILHLLL